MYTSNIEKYDRENSYDFNSNEYREFIARKLNTVVRIFVILANIELGSSMDDFIK